MNRAFRYILGVLFSLSCQSFAAEVVENPEVLKVAVLGLGGRAQDLLLQCLKLKNQVHKEIEVVAVCDDFAQNSLEFYIHKLSKEQNPLAGEYQTMMSHASFYPDNAQGLMELFERHPNLDKVMIASANYRHFTHLNAALDNSFCKSLFIEKPIFRSLEEFTAFKGNTEETTIHVGLTLRYAPMTKIVAQKLGEYRLQLGRLRKVQSWEHVNFSHAFSIILMNWRRYQSLSGGLLLEKSVHDLDLALFFMQAAGVNPKSLEIKTTASHEFFKKSRKKEIADRLLQDRALREKAESWDAVPWQRVIQFAYDTSGSIHWPLTLDAFFQEFPDNDDFSHSDLIPDRQKLTAKIETTEGDFIDFELDVKLGEFTLKTERGTHFTFEHGEVIVDIEQSKLRINLGAASALEFDLYADGQSHAGGDVYVAHTFLGTLPQGQHIAVFNDPAVQLSTVMGVVSEHQALRGIQGAIRLTKAGSTWSCSQNDK